MEINLNHLKAVNIMASKEQVRYYLNGVCLVVGNAGFYFVATNGHALVVYGDGDIREVFHAEGTQKCIIPREFIDKIKPDKKNPMGQLSIEGDTVKIEHDGKIMTAGLVDGTFPDIIRILPGEPEEISEIDFNGDYLADFAKVAKGMGDKKARIKFNFYGPGNAALITPTDLDQKWFGLLMPLRG